MACRARICRRAVIRVRLSRARCPRPPRGAAALSIARRKLQALLYSSATTRGHATCPHVPSAINYIYNNNWSITERPTPPQARAARFSMKRCATPRRCPRQLATAARTRPSSTSTNVVFRTKHKKLQTTFHTPKKLCHTTSASIHRAPRLESNTPSPVPPCSTITKESLLFVNAPPALSLPTTAKQDVRRSSNTRTLSNPLHTINFLPSFRPVRPVRLIARSCQLALPRHVLNPAE
eukprot:gb/GEZJ01001099.1/.p1 GENE.gb/GEZJ01001099.1/~~gb/GEZJ01001099.1/.p1  ORF type:complete len:236 (+),score=15.67 gb/GEZJ01001099.1/:166-873(+)